MIDPEFGTDDFGMPKFSTETETIVKNFLMLLVGKPGFFPSLPTIGMDISQYLYKFIDEINIPVLKAKLQNQCSDFLPYIDSGDFDIDKTVINDSGKVALVFMLPEIDNGRNIIIAVTTDSNGYVIYRFVEDIKQLL